MNETTRWTLTPNMLEELRSIFRVPDVATMLHSAEARLTYEERDMLRWMLTGAYPTKPTIEARSYRGAAHFEIGEWDGGDWIVHVNTDPEGVHMREFVAAVDKLRQWEHAAR